MRNLATYLNERFPLAVTIPHSLATAFLLVSITSVKDQHLSALLIAVNFLFFMLRMRVTDEFKDSAHDSSHYPDRPVQRGIISRRQLIIVGVISLLVELFTAFMAGVLAGNPASFIWYLAILSYSVLTRFEFFAAEFLEKHFNLYFFSHQAIFILYPIWAFNMFGKSLDQRGLLGATAFILFMALMEIMRKYEIRRNPAGEVVMDTYLSVWGAKAFWIMAIVLATGSVALYFAKQQPIFAILGFLSVLLMVLLKKNNDGVRAVVALTFLLESVLCYLI
ncbi:MAG: hypothetical protein EBR26_03055 [Microbacteriaceae bacterium]|nr:hypothetical protein [Microbacteriaceae bacterium]